MPVDPASSSSAMRIAWRGWLLALAGVLVVAGAGLGLWRAAHRPLGVDGVATPALPVSASMGELQQALANARKSDEISRAANVDLQKTLAQRDEEIAALKADIAFYQRFMGATADRRPLAVQGVHGEKQAGNVWRLEAMIAQNTQRNTDNTGKLRLEMEGMQGETLRKLAWTDLRQDAGSDGLPYDFKYFQQVSADVALPPDFTPTRVITRLQPAGGSVVENSFAWKDVIGS